MTAFQLANKSGAVFSAIMFVDSFIVSGVKVICSSKALNPELALLQ
jgi:hypothetical protein